ILRRPRTLAAPLAGPTPGEAVRTPRRTSCRRGCRGVPEDSLPFPAGALHRIQEVPRNLEIYRVEAFREPAVDLAENPSCLLTVPVLRKQATQARRSSKL